MFINKLHRLKIYHGILCPGFINSHCHLELSHLKGMANNFVLEQKKDEKENK